MSTDPVRLSPDGPADAARLAGAVARALVRNRDHMRPWEPHRSAAFFTPEGQAVRLAPDPAVRRWHLTDGRRVVGEASLTGIELGPFRSASLGYWIDAEYTGRGLATRAVEEVCRAAREELGLHRIQAGTLLDNAASQRVLAKCSFEVIGTAPRYLHINGEWRDHRLFQRVLHNDPPTP
ncbi:MULTISPECIES: GNAT family protein [unclassified Streptomyces]|uniref:GNAT family N-acetyltransferase n=1 Tax=unclassified Streptomyces TaxID=2593676 RepID=UPI002DDB2CC8|nr:GNAT family protein [Streptomyces sp. NBC_01750]WSB02534.1 GNAT family N-acetyltransferase [Streptomyces sp. NBC_01794]WSD33204.1 GNAT family N-acetyltransferase [Streptomyces sp. NBC_01750]